MAPSEPNREIGSPRPSDGARVDAPDNQSFVALVRDALLHLHDPPSLEVHQLARLIPRDQVARARGTGRALRQSLVDAIEGLRPPRDVSPQSHAWRVYRLLHERYVEARPTTDVQAELGISSSAYHLAHRSALEGLAVLLRAAWGLNAPTGEDVSSPVGASPSGTRRREPEPTAHRHNLPLSLTSFVGREVEMAEVRRLLGATRLLTVTGAGGCGKTRLAHEAARSLVGAYADGVWLVQLAPVADPVLVPQVVAATLGVREVEDEPIAATIVRRLEPTHTLLVLDNCEHLLDAAASLAETLLLICPRLVVLATSREPLGVAGETVLHVPPLSVPSVDESRGREASLRAVLSHDASRLFLDRARSVLPSFVATPSNALAIASICRQLDGIPLAVELAAARVRALSPEQIASRLDHDFHLLTGGSRTALPRQQTLKATLDWSHDLLSDPERLLLRRLSVFAGGFSLEAAEGICSGGGMGTGIQEQEVVSLLAELVDRSLVEVDTTAGEGRYRLLESVRQYALHRLEEAGEVETIRRGHAGWLAEYIRQIGDERTPGGEAAWMRRIAPEEENVRAALAWSAEDDPGLGLRLANRMWRYWSYHGRYDQGRRWLDEMISRNPERTTARAFALFFAAGDDANKADYERSAPLCSECLSILLELGDDTQTIGPLIVSGRIASDRGDHALARSLLERAAALGRQHDSTNALASALQLLGNDAWIVGDYSTSRQLLLDALDLVKRVGSQEGIGITQSYLGGLACSEGAHALARAHLAESVNAHRVVDFEPVAPIHLNRLGYVSLREGDLSRARAEFAECLRLAAPFAWRTTMSVCLAYLAMLAIREREAPRAARLGGAAVAVNPYMRHLLPPDQVADLDACLAEARAALGESAFARAWAEGKAMTLDQAAEYALEQGRGET